MGPVSKCDFDKKTKKTNNPPPPYFYQKDQSKYFWCISLYTAAYMQRLANPKTWQKQKMKIQKHKHAS